MVFKNQDVVVGMFIATRVSLLLGPRQVELENVYVYVSVCDLYTLMHIYVSFNIYIPIC